jgi:hypothetical protein
MGSATEHRERRTLLRLLILVYLSPEWERMSHIPRASYPMNQPCFHPPRASILRPGLAALARISFKMTKSGCGFGVALWVVLTYRRFAKTPALRCAIASIVIMGFTPEADGNAEPSSTSTFPASQHSPSGLLAEFFAEFPIRAEPMI